jgi:hypothetical protein
MCLIVSLCVSERCPQVGQNFISLMRCLLQLRHTYAINIFGMTIIVIAVIDRVVP